MKDSIENKTSDEREVGVSDATDLKRRAVVIGGASLLAGAALVGCRGERGAQSSRERNRNTGTDGRDYAILPPLGAAREFTLTAAPAEVEIASGRRVAGWMYDGKLPGTEIRVREGERVRVTLRNSLSQATSIHWHGLPMRGTNSMDGVPFLTQPPIQTDATFVYDFRAEPAGTFIFHPHSGLQIERGLYGAFVIEPNRETLQYDREYVLVFDDWLDGSPEDAFEKLRRGEVQHGAMSGMGSGDMGEMPGMNTEGASGGGKQGAGSTAVQMEEGADVAHSTFLINGRSPEAPPEFEIKRGERARLRLANPSGSTIFRVAIGGHRMTVTHADALAVRPVEVDALEIAPGERYDVVLTANNPGVWAIAAMSTDEPQRGARAILRYTDARASSAPNAGDLPQELRGRVLSYDQLVALDEANIAAQPERRLDLTLGGQMMPYDWTINGKLMDENKPLEIEPFEIRAGERVRVTMANESLMRHPMHLHGHSFRVLAENGQGNAAPLKDTVIVEPRRTLAFEFLADNPGDWLFHCHHAYHLAAGMARVFKYV